MLYFKEDILKDKKRFFQLSCVVSYLCIHSTRFQKTFLYLKKKPNIVCRQQFKCRSNGKTSLNVLKTYWRRRKVRLPTFSPFSKMFSRGSTAAKYTELQKNRRTHTHKKKNNSQFSLHLYNEIVYMCNDKILVQR